MNNFFRKNQKKLLAIFAAVLMVLFILPSTPNGMGRRTNEVIGRMNGAKVHQSDLFQATREWLILKSIPVNQFETLPEAMLGASLVMEIDPEIMRRDAAPKNPEVYWLLQQEAKREGVKVSDASIEGTMRFLAQRGMRDPEATAEALRGLLAVEALIDRVGSAVKISEPMIDRHMALTSQTPTLKMVEFRAEAYAKDVPAPTTQQAAEQFGKYADVPASQPTLGVNPFGFGYKYPNRVQIQYLTVANAQVMEAVRKSKSDFDWKLDAYRYYNTHLDEFQETPRPTSQPETQSTTNATNPATAPAASTQPTTQPFERVQDRALERAMRGDVENKTKEVAQAIRDRLTADWEASKKSSAPAGGSLTTQPSGFGSAASLQQLADDIERRLGVRPEVHVVQNTWLDAQGLSGLRGIGDSFSDAGAFATIALDRAEPLLPADQRGAPDVLSLFKPSSSFRDAQRNVYIFQITAAEPAHAPTTMEAVADRVQEDVRKRETYAKAKQEAEKFLESVRASNLTAAAAAVSREVVNEDFSFSFLNPNTLDLQLLSRYRVSTEAEPMFLSEVRKLMAAANQTNPHPVALIELPTEGKALVVEMTSVSSKTPEALYALLRYRAGQQLRQDGQERLRSTYFSRDAIVARMGYRAEGNSSSAAKPAAARL